MNAHSPTVQANFPDVVGRYLVGEQSHFFSCKRSELDRAAVSVAHTVDSFAIAPGRFVLTVSLTQEVVQFAPFEQACRILGLIGSNADASPFDAGRVESILRQFDVAAVCGVDAGVLEGLVSFGHEPAKVFAGRIVWARPDAFARVAALPGVTARRCAEIGPILGLQCAKGDGLHYDARDWTVTAVDGVLEFSSRSPRIDPLHHLHTGVRGRVETMPCPCGSPDPRLMLDFD